MYLILLAIALLIIIPPLILYKFPRSNVSVQGPFVLWKFKGGRDLLKKIARHGQFVNVFANVGVISSFGIFSLKYVENKLLYYFIYALLLIPLIFSLPVDSLICLVFGFGGYALYLLSTQAFFILSKLYTGVVPTPGIIPIIPGISIPGIGTVPWEVIFSLAIIVLFHEFSHGIVALFHKIKVKSLGIAFIGAIPFGAFTEIDDKAIERASKKTKIRVFSAGSYANYLVALFFFFLLNTLSPYLYHYQASIFFSSVSSIKVLGVAPGSLADQLNLTNATIFNPTALLSPNETVTLITSKGNFTVQKSTLGIISYDYNLTRPLPFLFYFFSSIRKFLMWTAYLNFVIALVNFLPLPIFDGGRISGFVFGRVGEKVLKGITVFLFLINAFPLVFYLI